MYDKQSKKYIPNIILFLFLVTLVFWDFELYSKIFTQLRNMPQTQPSSTATVTPTSIEQESHNLTLATVIPAQNGDLDPTTISTKAQPYEMVHTEVLHQIGATEYHARGYLGQGVRVAIIDNQFDGYSDRIRLGELPSNTLTLYFDENGRLSPNLVFGRGSHGTACAEIIHDVSPGAQLILVQTENFILNLANILDYLHTINVDIISLSLSILTSSRLIQRNDAIEAQVPIYELLHNAVQENGMFIVVSAGNYARQHYQGIFTDTNGNGWHEFTEVHTSADPAESVSFNLGKDKTIELSLSWENPNAAVTESREPVNYTLLVYNSTGEEISRSSRLAIDDATQFTSISFTSDIEETYTIKIQTDGVSRQNDLLDLFIKGEPAPLNQYQVAGNSLAIPAESPDVFTVGAADALNFTLDSTSSRGIPGSVIIKPDATSFAHVSVSSPGYGTRGFSGTSSAAPHVAGMAALLLGQPQNQHLNPEELEKHLLSFVEDKGMLRSDHAWGAGLVRLTPLEANCDILFPSTENPITSISALYKQQVIASVTRSNNQPVYGLNPSDFQITVGNIQAEIITQRHIDEKYAFEILLPLLPSGKYDLRVMALNSECVLSQAVVYARVTNPVQAFDQQSYFQFSFTPLNPSIGSILWFLAALSDTAPISRTTIKMDVTHPDGHTTHLQLYDDGMRLDGVAEDGIYGNAFSHTHHPGRYKVRFHVSGISSLGKHFQITKMSVFWVDQVIVDFDMDGMPDIWERAVGLNHHLNDAYNDPDYDGLINIDEYSNGAHPFNWDTDDDSLSDFQELAGYYTTNPNSRDSDLGGKSDADELLQNSNPLDPKDDFTHIRQVYMPLHMRAFIPTYHAPDRTLMIDANLWIATQHGLIQWDLASHTYKKYTIYHGLLDNHIHALDVHTSGDIWLGSDTGLSIVHHSLQSEKTTITPLSTNILPPTPIKAIAAQPNGNMWVGTSHGISVFNGTTWRTYNQLNNIKLNSVQALAIADNNTLWIGTQHGLLRTTITEHSTLRLVDAHPTNKLIEHAWVTDILIDNKNMVWISTWGGGVSVLVDNQWTTYTKDDGLADNYVYQLTTGNDGTLWIVTLHGLNSHNPSIAGGRWITYVDRESQKYGLPDGNINTFYTKQNGKQQTVPYTKYPIPASLVLSWNKTQPPFFGLEQSVTVSETSSSYTWQHYESAQPILPILSTAAHPDGKIWFGLHNGITIYEPENDRWRIPGFNHEIPQVQANTIVHTPNSTWVGTNGLGLLEFKGGQWQQHNRADGLGSLFVHSMSTDSLGRFWVGSGSGLGGVSYLQDGDWHSRDQLGFLSTDYIYAIASTHDGSIWFGTNKGLFVSKESLMLDGDYINHLANHYIWAAAVDSNDVWLGTNSGVLRWDGLNWRSYTTLDGISNNQVWDITIDTLQRIWVATSEGLSMYDAGTWQSFSLADNHKKNHIWDISINPGNNDVWLATEGGILSFHMIP